MPQRATGISTATLDRVKMLLQAYRVFGGRGSPQGIRATVPNAYEKLHSKRIFKSIMPPVPDHFTTGVLFIPFTEKCSGKQVGVNMDDLHLYYFPGCSEAVPWSYPVQRSCLTQVKQGADFPEAWLPLIKKQEDPKEQKMCLNSGNGKWKKISKMCVP